MILIRDIFQFEAPWEECVVTLGTFDGFHRGHLSLIARMKNKAARKNLPAVLITYDPNPARIVKPDKFSDEIHSLDEKMDILHQLGLDAAVIIHFDRQLAQKSASWYVEEVLKKRLRCSTIVLGDDHAFGHRREGNFDWLKKNEKEFHIQTHQIREITLMGKRASSTEIRQQLLNGNLPLVNRMLAHTWFIQGEVVSGKQIGRQIGFPTANIDYPSGKLLPKNGVYAGYVTYADQLAEPSAGKNNSRDALSKFYPAVANIGTRPTVDASSRVSVEAHIISGNHDLYGKQVRLYLSQQLRSELKFESLASLKDQISSDCQNALKILQKEPIVLDKRQQKR